jgi:hypothetical protein
MLIADLVNVSDFRPARCWDSCAGVYTGRLMDRVFQYR